MTEGVLGYSATKGELRRHFIDLKKEAIALRQATRITRYETTKWLYKNNKVAKRIYLCAAVSIVLSKVSSTFSLWTYISKIFIGVGLGTAGTTVGVAGVASAVLLSSAAHKTQGSALAMSPTVEITNPAVASQALPVKPARMDPIFKPKFATVVLISSEILECKIVDYTSEYIKVEVNGERRIIPQKDIYEIRGI